MATEDWWEGIGHNLIKSAEVRIGNDISEYWMCTTCYHSHGSACDAMPKLCGAQLYKSVYSREKLRQSLLKYGLEVTDSQADAIYKDTTQIPEDIVQRVRQETEEYDCDILDLLDHTEDISTGLCTGTEFSRTSGGILIDKVQGDWLDIWRHQSNSGYM